MPLWECCWYHFQCDHNRAGTLGLWSGRHLWRARHARPPRDLPLLLPHLRRGPSRGPGGIRRDPG